MRVISKESTGVLELDANLSEGKTVREILKQKHPEGADAEFESLLRPNEEPTVPHPVIFDELPGQAIKAAALRTFGSARPSGIDANGWKDCAVRFMVRLDHSATPLLLLHVDLQPAMLTLMVLHH